MKNPVNPPVVSFCGLYCSNCPKFKKNKCPGCQANNKATWCKVRNCCLETNRSSCAECTDHADLKQCPKLNNFVSKAFGLVFNSDRMAGIRYIRSHGPNAFAAKLDAEKAMAFKKRGSTQ